MTSGSANIDRQFVERFGFSWLSLVLYSSLDVSVVIFFFSVTTTTTSWFLIDVNSKIITFVNNVILVWSSEICMRLPNRIILRHAAKHHCSTKTEIYSTTTKNVFYFVSDPAGRCMRPNGADGLERFPRSHTELNYTCTAVIPSNPIQTANVIAKFKPYT